MTQFVNDTFTDTDNTLLSAHTGEMGATWTQITGNETSQDMRIYGNRLCYDGLGGSGNSAMYKASGTPGSADYYVEAVSYMVTSPGTHYFGIAGRVQNGSTYYMVWYNGGVYTMLRSGTTVGTYNATQNIATAYTWKLDISGTGATVSLAFYLDGVSRITYSDTDGARITSAGNAAVFQRDGSTTTGCHWESFAAYDSLTAGGLLLPRKGRAFSSIITR